MSGAYLGRYLLVCTGILPKHGKREREISKVMRPIFTIASRCLGIYTKQLIVRNACVLPPCGLLFSRPFVDDYTMAMV